MRGHTSFRGKVLSYRHYRLYCGAAPLSFLRLFFPKVHPHRLLFGVFISSRVLVNCPFGCTGRVFVPPPGRSGIFSRHCFSSFWRVFRFSHSRDALLLAYPPRFYRPVRFSNRLCAFRRRCFFSASRADRQVAL